MSVKTRDLGMTPLDDLFSTDESRAESQFEKVVTLNPAEISDFPNHPFKVKQDDAMAEMVESVRKYGVLVPALVRPKENGGYEMVAGHRRKFAAALAELTEIPCIVRNLSDDEATIIMVDSNLQRETILPSEKAFAYINAEDGLELPSIVLLEQLRTVDKRRLGDFIGHLSDKHIRGINHALAVSIGLIESIPKKLILCLCSACADNFYGSGAYSLRRIDPQQTEKDTCTYCNQRTGYDYEIIPKNR